MSEPELRLEIALMLYQQRKIGGGKARELAGVSILEFRQEAAHRGICIDYDVEDLHADIETLRSLDRL